MEKKILYSAIVLDDSSRSKILSAVAIPDGWKFIGHHFTIKLGELNDEEKKSYRIGESVTLICTKAGRTNKALALKVDNQTRFMDGTPHITVAVNVTAGGKPKDSNNIALFYEPVDKLILTGTIQEIL